jgi:hypothetical protein
MTRLVRDQKLGCVGVSVVTQISWSVSVLVSVVITFWMALFLVASGAVNRIRCGTLSAPV